MFSTLKGEKKGGEGLTVYDLRITCTCATLLLLVCNMIRHASNTHYLYPVSQKTEQKARLCAAGDVTLTSWSRNIPVI